MKDLKVFLDDNSTFSDISEDMQTYLRDSVSMPLVAAEDTLYAGLYKNFGRIYVDLSVVNTNTATLTIQYYNGTTWAAATNVKDFTKGFTRSGFIEWDLALTDWAATEVNSESQYWIKIVPSVDFSATTAIQGLNIVFANDLDLQEGYYTINDLIPSGAESFISSHQAARNEIIQDIRNSGKAKVNNGSVLDITKWDVLRPDQLREAGKWKALQIIFFGMSNEVDDKYDQLSKDALEKYKIAINLYLLTLDGNDDGAETEDEKELVTYLTLKRY